MTLLRSVLGLSLAVSALAVSGIAHAGTCEDTFTKKGNEISGIRFVATTVVPDMSPKIAIQVLLL